MFEACIIIYLSYQCVCCMYSCMKYICLRPHFFLVVMLYIFFYYYYMCVRLMWLYMTHFVLILKFALSLFFPVLLEFVCSVDFWTLYDILEFIFHVFCKLRCFIYEWKCSSLLLASLPLDIRQKPYQTQYYKRFFCFSC